MSLCLQRGGTYTNLANLSLPRGPVQERGTTMLKYTEVSGNLFVTGTTSISGLFASGSTTLSTTTIYGNKAVALTVVGDVDDRHNAPMCMTAPWHQGKA